ncbi:MAG: hypothetical protein RLZZ519_1261 [Bacteroidota bacterium]|jgi:hypothetical protein
MPIQIRELVVTATVEEKTSTPTATASPATASQQDAQLKAEIIQACVDEVLKTLKMQTRR